MDIAFPCPACRYEIKAKEELVGQKVNCPKCTAIVTVPTGEDLPVRQDRRYNQEEFTEETRPLQKANNIKYLLIALFVGGIGLLLLGLLVLAMVLVLTGDRGGK